jgi:hypothetical protein
LGRSILAVMDEHSRLEAKALARVKLRARRRRVRMIRVRAATASVMLFAVAWAIVFGQLVSGNDPVLSRFGSQAVASTHRRSQVPVSPEPEAEPAPEAELKAEPELEPEPEMEPEFEPEPEPVVTSAS